MNTDNGVTSSPPLVRVNNLRVELPVGIRDSVTAVRDVSLRIAPGQRVGLVGESGSGKSVTGRTISGLLPLSRRVKVSGEVEVGGVSIEGVRSPHWRRVRRELVGMIFQDPLSYLNPTMTIGRQVQEAIRRASDSPAPDTEGVRHYLDMAGLSEIDSLVRRYPFELSGGMRQRVLIAIALAKQPKLIIADEPTTALDVTVQAKVLQSLDRSVDELGAALLMISHDLAVVARMCDYVYVMAQGRVVEAGPTIEVFTNPNEDYTVRLLKNVRKLSII